MRRGIAVSFLTVANVLLCCVVSGGPVAAQKSDELVMVVNKNNASVAPMRKQVARKLLLGETVTWPNGSKILVVMMPAGNSDRAEVLKRICGMGESEFTRYNLQAMFMGGSVAAVQIAPNAVAVRSVVRGNPDAVGFLRQSEVDNSVRAVWTLE